MSLEVGEKEEKLYYYCPWDVFESIIKNKSIWFSRFEDCYDCAEDNLFINLLCDYINSLDNKKDIPVVLYPYILKTSNSNNSIFGLCLSSEKDNPAMWQNFTEKNNVGVCIELDKNKLKKFLSSLEVQEKKLELKEVKYVNHKKYKGNDDLITTFDSIIENPDYENIILPNSAIWKLKEFSYEKETRIIFRVCWTDDIPNNYSPLVKVEKSEGKTEIQITQSKGKIHYEVPFDLSIISGVIIDPRTSSQFDFKNLKYIGNDITINIRKSKLKRFIKYIPHNNSFDNDTSDLEHLNSDEGWQDFQKTKMQYIEIKGEENEN